MQTTVKVSKPEEYDIVIGTCSDIFTKKMHDYGMAWRMR